jgi:ubiquinone/menaquinone biosynthesis C-methylase UbiE
MMTKMSTYLKQVASSSAGGEIKSRALELLGVKGGAQVVDVGCGPGVDTVPLARLAGPSGRVVGVDSDPAMIQEAKAHALNQGVSAWTEHHVALATALPVSAESMDAWHSERVLQHLPGTQPLLALKEATRVLRPGGRLVVVDTDWGTLSIATQLFDVERRLVRLHAARFASGLVGRVLPRLVRQAGLLRSHVEFFAVPLSPDTLDFVLKATEQEALAAHIITPLEWQQWRLDLDDFRACGDSVATVTMTLVGAQRP